MVSGSFEEKVVECDNTFSCSCIFDECRYVYFNVEHYDERSKYVFEIIAFEDVGNTPENCAWTTPGTDNDMYCHATLASSEFAVDDIRVVRRRKKKEIKAKEIEKANDVEMSTEQKLQLKRSLSAAKRSDSAASPRLNRENSYSFLDELNPKRQKLPGPKGMEQPEGGPFTGPVLQDNFSEEDLVMFADEIICESSSAQESSSIFSDEVAAEFFGDKVKSDFLLAANSSSKVGADVISSESAETETKAKASHAEATRTKQDLQEATVDDDLKSPEPRKSTIVCEKGTKGNSGIKAGCFAWLFSCLRISSSSSAAPRGVEMVSSQHSENSSSSSRAVMLSTRMDSKTSGSSFEAGASEKPLPYARVVENSGDDLVKDCELKSPQPTAPPRASSMDAKIDSLKEGSISRNELYDAGEKHLCVFTAF